MHGKGGGAVVSDDVGEDEMAMRFQDHEVLIWIRPVGGSGGGVGGVWGGGGNSNSVVAGGGIGSDNVGGVVGKSHGSPAGKGKVGVSSGGIGSMFKFTDVRTMLVTLFDTCKPLCPNGSVSGHGVCIKVSNLFASLSPHLSVSKMTIGYPLCDRFMKFFDSAVRYEVGNLSSESKYYHGYQQVGVPYMLCPDSHRLQRFVEMTKLVGDQVLHGIEKKSLYRRYCKQYDGGKRSTLNDSELFLTNRVGVSFKESLLEGSETKFDNVNKKSKMPTYLEMDLNDRKEITIKSPSVVHSWGDQLIDVAKDKVSSHRRKFIGRAMFVSYDPRHAGELGVDRSTSSSSNFLNCYPSILSHFRSLSWKCKSTQISYLDEVICNQEIGQMDCLILDPEIKLFVSQSPLIRNYNNVFDEYSSASNMATANTVPLIAELKDIIHMLRHIGFSGLIVLLQFPSANNDASSPSHVLSTIDHNSGYSFNQYIHAFTADLTLEIPLSLDDIKRITRMAEKSILSCL